MNIKVETRTKTDSKVVLEREELETFLREHLGAPEYVDITFEVSGGRFVESATITWESEGPTQVAERSTK